jgi:two-component system, LytTR family, response regulator AlgR
VWPEMLNQGGPEKANVAAILVVDDEEIVCNYMKRALADAGYRVIGVRSGLEALAILRTTRVRLVITDIRMPDMGGLELGREISRLASPPPVVYASASDRPPAEAAGLYLQKPFKASELADLVREVLALGPNH